MKPYLPLITAAALAVLPTLALAQVDAHHPGKGAGETPAPGATLAPAPLTGNAADQSANMMQMMGQMMPMMQQMTQMMQIMQGAQGMPSGTTGMAIDGAGMSDASQAYMNAMTKMDMPMMQGAQARDPDVAFVQAMIPHHQGAIDMAKAVLQYGKDPGVKEWANQIIKAQEAEMAEMQAWLNEHPQ